MSTLTCTVCHLKLFGKTGTKLETIKIKSLATSTENNMEINLTIVSSIQDQGEIYTPGKVAYSTYF